MLQHRHHARNVVFLLVRSSFLGEQKALEKGCLHVRSLSFSTQWTKLIACAMLACNFVLSFVTWVILCSTALRALFCPPLVVTFGGASSRPFAFALPASSCFSSFTVGVAASSELSVACVVAGMGSDFAEVVLFAGVGTACEVGVEKRLRQKIHHAKFCILA